MTPLAISSTAIRTLCSEGASIRYLTPDSVVEFIRSHNLYGRTRPTVPLPEASP
jgi:nicotinate-nucleotide adenylyltransferase